MPGSHYDLGCYVCQKPATVKIRQKNRIWYGLCDEHFDLACTAQPLTIQTLRRWIKNMSKQRHDQR